jgi:hypothetical protein
MSDQGWTGGSSLDYTIARRSAKKIWHKSIDYGKWRFRSDSQQALAVTEGLRQMENDMKKKAGKIRGLKRKVKSRREENWSISPGERDAPIELDSSQSRRSPSPEEADYEEVLVPASPTRSEDSASPTSDREQDQYPGAVSNCDIISSQDFGDDEFDDEMLGEIMDGYEMRK